MKFKLGKMSRRRANSLQANFQKATNGGCGLPQSARKAIGFLWRRFHTHGDWPTAAGEITISKKNIFVEKLLYFDFSKDGKAGGGSRKACYISFDIPLDGSEAIVALAAIETISAAQSAPWREFNARAHQELTGLPITESWRR